MRQNIHDKDMAEIEKLPFSHRAGLPGTAPLAADLFSLMESKQSNLCLAADVTSSAELLYIAEDLGDQIVILKTHADIVDDWSHETADALLAISIRKRFFIFEDRKFGDIGSITPVDSPRSPAEYGVDTVQRQYTRGPLRIANWAHLTNCHILPGESIAKTLSDAADELSEQETKLTGKPRIARGLLLLAEMSSDGNLMTGDYVSACVRLARKSTNFVTGLIAQSNVREAGDNFLIMSPGIQLPPQGMEHGLGTTDGLGQQYRTPSTVILNEGCDIIIVGRGILSANNRRDEAERYRREGWTAYTQRVLGR